jgi:cytoskeleton protein RodZ
MPEWSGRAAATALAVGAIAFTWWFMKPPGAPEPIAEATPPAAEPAQLELPQPEVQALPAPEPTAAEAAADEAVAAEEAAPEATEAVAAEVVSAESFSAPGDGALELPVTVELRFEFPEDCWVEINDARGTRLAYRLYRAGDVARLRGVAPVEVFLGNAEGVRLTVDDTPVAVRPAARRDGTARLTVGGGTG